MTQLTSFEVMEYSDAPENHKTSCLAVGLNAKKILSQTAKKIDRASRSAITSLLKKGEIEGKVGQTLLLHNVPHIKAERLLLVGSGDNESYNKVIDSLVESVVKSQATDLVIPLSDFSDEEPYWLIRRTIESVNKALYTFNQYKSKKLKIAPLKTVCFILPKSSSPSSFASAKMAVREGIALARAINHTKDLGNLPPNVCTPTYLANYAKALVKKHKKLSVSVLDKKDMIKLKMGLLLSVTQGSTEPPKFIILNYKGLKSPKKASDAKPVVLVGKGITFDTGGNSIKPSLNMIGMKYDMCGAATVLGVIECASQLNLPINIVGLIPTCENMPGGNASRPDDIVTSMSGMTVEILNTDAEGRLILADALTYAQRYNPKVVIDISTLTGACIIALGHQASGLLGNDASLVQALLAAGQQTYDRAWELPLWPEYESILHSKFADIANVNANSSPNAGTITGAMFLSKFAQKYHWAHLDVAGTACHFGGEHKGATGRPVSLLVQYLFNEISKT